MIRLAVCAWARVTAEGSDRHVGPIRAVWPRAPARVERTDKASALALMVASEVVERAARPPGTQLGVFLGTALGCADVNDRFHRGLISEGVNGASPRLFAQTIPSGPAGEVAIAQRALGHSVTVMAGRCAGLAALVEARRALATGRCDAAVVLAGDVFGDDRTALWGNDRAGAPREAMVALYLESAEGAAGPGVAVIERVEVHRDAERAALPAPDWLGASGLVEFTRWLDAPTERFDAQVRFSDGHQGGLYASARLTHVLTSGGPLT